MSATAQAISSSFIQRTLRASLVLPAGNFPGTSANTLVLQGFRMSATVTGAAGYPSTCSLRVNGMKQTDMNALSVLWAVPTQFAPGVPSAGVPTPINARGQLVLEVGTPQGGWFQVFAGTLVEGGADYSAMPDVAFMAEAKVGYDWQVLTAAPSSFSGATSIAAIAAQFASQMGYAFENDGVTGTLNAPYFHGSLMDQWNDLADAAGFDYYLEGRGVLAICPKNQPRQQPLTKVLNASSGLVGYPQTARFGVRVQCLFDPAVELGSPIQIGGTVVNNTIVPSPQAASGGYPAGTIGLWYPYSATHSLSSLTPGGPWFSQLLCMPSPSAG